MSGRVVIIDYGMGNLFSVRNTFAALKVAAHIAGTPAGLKGCDRLILPGVGAFGDAMRELKKRGLVEPIRDFVRTGKPFLGICLGMQLLMEESAEAPGVRGLGLIRGAVRRFGAGRKCPHMGWNEIEAVSGEPFFAGVPRPVYVYFCHSYYVRPRTPRVAIGTTRYGARFASIVRSRNVYGVQFHPEKSQDTGLALLKNFLAIPLPCGGRA
ncbi:MAG: imidazole glycerol phosphate synthase subunit HisH [Deltaproteobacteria bacterium]